MAGAATKIKSEPATTLQDWRQTDVGSVFVSNYPPYSFWRRDGLEAAAEAIQGEPIPGTDLGLYLHIPFCRRRCKFCYFKIYTGKKRSEIETYMNALKREVGFAASQGLARGRALKFIYFGGGTPSYLGVRDLTELGESIAAAFDTSQLQEVTFECEPGTLSRRKLEAIREMGVTRLSLGVENYNDQILEENGRAHQSAEIFEALPWIHDLNFRQLNVDLIAGMLGETWENWRHNVELAIQSEADSITIYQMELPFNTTYSKQILEDGKSLSIADWDTKREWHSYAIDRLAEAGYEGSSAYTMVRSRRRSPFVYRDSVWQGCDLLGLGVSSFSYAQGIHYQNQVSWNDYLRDVEEGRLPVSRVLVPSDEERWTREWILQLKLGEVKSSPFIEKFGIDPIRHFATQIQKLHDDKMLTFDRQQVRLTRRGLLQVDQLLPIFYNPRYQGARYT